MLALYRTYVCMSVIVYVCMCVITYVCLYVCMYVCMNVCIYVCICVIMYVYSSHVIIYTCMTVFFRLSAHAHICAQGLFFMVRGGMASTNVMKNSLNFLPEEVRKAKSHTFPLAVSANQRWNPQFQQFLRALNVDFRRMIVLMIVLMIGPSNYLFTCRIVAANV